ncbi:MAG: pyridoxal phosphate-dependent aminotransferase [Tepidibacter sp.]|jgi:aspartate/methionine/tyrosine aminotransferase|uniref:pyridoxal phosphate-dependent aminotransferase n=1 Tax=Tepidibacter sp. TaxID=2529387 RepID=UPI0025EBB55A|nr:pyridoxal phosphate-dependent aminotransferase [Tepidibacter sp.]MCT4508277.1 pyridoxal phosphate-dependent aminotransferase [Tepidibacter sp.]
MKYISKRYLNKAITPMAESMNHTRKYEDLIDLSLGDHDINTDIRIIDKAFEDARNGHTHYTNSLGYLELREKICDYYKDKYSYSLDTKECMITTSGCHAMYLVLEALLDDGDEVIIHEPYFTPYKEQVEITRGKPVFLKTYEEDEFKINIDKLKESMTHNTKAIILNTPNNPTGACFDKEILQEIANVCIEKDIVVIADDIYTLFMYEDEFIPITTLEKMRERTITIGSFSKDYAMTGWRIGYILAPSYVIQTIRSINENSVFTAPSISQRAAIHALSMRNQVQPPIKDEYKNRIYYAYDRIKSIPNISVIKPKGSIYLFVNIKKTGLTSKEVVDRILNEAHVLTIPGEAFGESGSGYIRIAVTQNIDRLKEAFDRISAMDIFLG